MSHNSKEYRYHRLTFQTKNISTTYFNTCILLAVDIIVQTKITPASKKTTRLES